MNTFIKNLWNETDYHDVFTLTLNIKGLGILGFCFSSKYIAIIFLGFMFGIKI